EALARGLLARQWSVVAFCTSRIGRTCITRHSSREPGTVAYCACPTFVVGHGQRRRPRLACYACSGLAASRSGRRLQSGRRPPVKSPLDASAGPPPPPPSDPRHTI